MGDKAGDKAGDKMGDISDDPFFALTKSQASVLTALRNNPNLTKPQLSSMLHLGKTTIDKAIKALWENGILTRIGSNKTGYWRVEEQR